MITEKDLFADIVNFQDLCQFVFKIGELEENEKMKKSAHQIAGKLWEDWFEDDEDYKKYTSFQKNDFRVRYSEGISKGDEWEEDEILDSFYRSPNKLEDDEDYKKYKEWFNGKDRIQEKFNLFIGDGGNIKPSGFENILFDLIFKSDKKNLNKLNKVYPEYVEKVANYKGIEHLLENWEIKGDGK